MLPFQRLVDEHGGTVWRFLVGAVGPNEAEDCWQETFLSALRAYPTLNGSVHAQAWLLKIAQNKAIDSHRSRGRRAEPVQEVPDEPVVVSNDDFEIWRAVAALSEKQRLAVLHRFVLDLPYRRIGELIGCSEAAARKNVQEGLRNLRGVVTR